jgi:hypothetical protein
MVLANWIDSVIKFFMQTSLRYKPDFVNITFCDNKRLPETGYFSRLPI